MGRARSPDGNPLRWLASQKTVRPRSKSKFRSLGVTALPTPRHRLFRASWWTTNSLLALVFLSLIYSAGWEYSVRQYLKGFSDAVVPALVSPESKVESILTWMRSGAPRSKAANRTNPLALRRCVRRRRCPLESEYRGARNGTKFKFGRFAHGKRGYPSSTFRRAGTLLRRETKLSCRR